MKTQGNTTPTCSCGNQHLITPGSTCEYCMGLVPECEPPVSLNEGWFDVAYFEALENELSKSILAA